MNSSWHRLLLNNTHKTDRHSNPRWDSNQQSQHVSGRSAATGTGNISIGQLKYVLILEQSLSFELNTNIVCMFAYNKSMYLNIPNLLFWTQKTEVFNHMFIAICYDQFTNKNCKSVGAKYYIEKSCCWLVITVTVIVYVIVMMKGLKICPCLMSSF